MKPLQFFTDIWRRFEELDPAQRLRWGVALSILLAFLVLLSGANDQLKRLAKKRGAQETALADMLRLRQRYQEASSGSQKLANRMATLKPDDSPAKLIDDIGIKGKNSQIKPLKGEESNAMIEDAAEIKLEGLTANETINLLHRLEKGAKPVIIKKALLKSRFDDPSRIDLVMTVALLRPAPQGQR
jgi:general secretion pathway protein M